MKQYSSLEERINITSHAAGLVLVVAGLVALVVKAARYGDAWHIVSAAIFGVSLVVLYAASTAYHSASDPVVRQRLRVFDHASIYVLIAGTYTPFTLVTMRGWVGWTLFGLVWAMALTGIILKLFFTGRYSLLSTLMYVFMGWMIVFAIKPLINSLPPGGMTWLIAGGLSYTVGALLYGFKKIRFTHAIFHVLVLAGSACHFVAVYEYVLPSG